MTDIRSFVGGWIGLAVLMCAPAASSASLSETGATQEEIEQQLSKLRAERQQVHRDARQRGSLIKQQRDEVRQVLADCTRRLQQLQRSGPDRSGWREVPVYAQDPATRKKVKAGTRIQLYSTSRDKTRHDQTYDLMVRRIARAEELLDFYESEAKAIGRDKRSKLERLEKELRRLILVRNEPVGH